MANMTESQEKAFLENIARLNGRRPQADSEQQKAEPTPVALEATPGQVFSDPTPHKGNLNQAPHSQEPEKPTPPKILPGENNSIVNTIGNKAHICPQNESKGNPDKSTGQNRNNAAEAKPKAAGGNSSLAEPEQRLPDNGEWLTPDLVEAIEARSKDPLPDPAQQAQAKQAGQEDKAQPIRIVRTADLRTLPKRKWIWNKILARNALMLFYGESGTGKTYLLVHIAAMLKSGGLLFGEAVINVSDVIYIYLEGADDAQERVDAWESFNESDYPDIGFIFEPWHIVHDIDRLKSVCPENSVIIIDTLSASCPDFDSSNEVDMKTVMSNLRAIIREKNSAVILTHHTGKDKTAGARGSYTLLADCDAQLEACGRDTDFHTLKIVKARSSKQGNEYIYKLPLIELGYDDDDTGEPVTSRAVEDLGIAKEKKELGKRKEKKPSGSKQRLALKAIENLLVEKPGIPVGLDEWRKMFYSLCVESNPETRKKNFKNAVEGLLANEFVQKVGESFLLA